MNRFRPRPPVTADPVAGAPVLAVRDLGVDFRVGGQWVMASRHVSFDILPGRVLALVGESGSGKIGRAHV